MQKYKVFFNEKSILFTTPGKITITKPSNNSPVFTDASSVNNWLDEFEKDTESEKIIETGEPELIFEKFRKSLLNIDAAGGVIKRNNRLLFIFRNGKWDLPKGKIDKGETVEEAALREVEEECSIRGHRIVRTLAPTYHLYRSPYKKSLGQWILKKTYWFEMAYDGDEKGVPQTDEGITEVRWLAPSELSEVLANTYGNLKAMIEVYSCGSQLEA